MNKFNIFLFFHYTQLISFVRVQISNKFNLGGRVNSFILVKNHWSFLSNKTPVYIFSLVLIAKAKLSTSDLE